MKRKPQAMIVGISMENRMRTSSHSNDKLVIFIYTQNILSKISH